MKTRCITSMTSGAWLRPAVWPGSRCPPMKSVLRGTVKPRLSPSLFTVPMPAKTWSSPNLQTRNVPTDSDQDGMPDTWETAQGLNPNVKDNNGHDLHLAYDNIEGYLASLTGADTGDINPPDLPPPANPQAPAPSACSDGKDNDGDGFCDTPSAVCTDGSDSGDPGCASPQDTDEYKPPPAGGPEAGSGQAAANLDCDTDNNVDVFDLALLMYFWDATPPFTTACGKNADFDGNASVDFRDFPHLRNCWGRPSPCTGAGGGGNGNGGGGGDDDGGGTNPPIPPPPDYDPKQGHTYPRTAVWQFGGAIPDWYARFDLVMSAEFNRDFISQTRQLNPNIIYLPTRDFNGGCDFMSCPEEWYLHYSDGSRIPLYDLDNRYYMNLSDLTSRVNGKIGVEALADKARDIVVESGADCMATDGLYGRFHYEFNCGREWMIDCERLDLDYNGQADFSEHGKEWFLDHWEAGVQTLLTRLRSNLVSVQSPNTALPEPPIMVNTGSPVMPIDGVINGLVYEHVEGLDNWTSAQREQADLLATIRLPMMTLINDHPVSGSATDYRAMRFGRARTMTLADMYYEFQDLTNGNSEHYWGRYYDEYDLDLGYPTGPMVQASGEVWVRFFEKGAVVVNVASGTQLIRDADLQQIPGYAGPYYRFQGGQDPNVNNGQQFSSIFLQGDTQKGLIVGDGIILVKQPQTVVSDIIIDNVQIGTSAGSTPAEFVGGFVQQDCGGGVDVLGAADYYTLRCSWNPGSDAFASVTRQNGAAVFVPTIGADGQYEVFEWHPRLTAASTDTQVTHTIRSAGGTATRVVNQNTQSGQWNSLGTYHFNPGRSGSVTIEATGNSGTVMADAIMFRYKGN